MSVLRKRDLVATTSVNETSSAIELHVSLVYTGLTKTTGHVHPVDPDDPEAGDTTTNYEKEASEHLLNTIMWDSDLLSLTHTEKALPQLGTPLYPRQNSTSKFSVTINNGGGVPRLVAAGSGGAVFDRGWLNKWCYVKAKHFGQAGGEPGLQVVWITEILSASTVRYTSINKDHRLAAGPAEVAMPYQRDRCMFFLTARQVMPAGPGRVHALLTYTHQKISPESMVTAREISTPFHFLNSTTRKHPMGASYTEGGVSAAANVNITPVIMDNHQTIPVMYPDAALAARHVRHFCGKVNGVAFLGYEPRRWLCMPAHTMPIGHSKRVYVVYRFALSNDGETHDPIAQFTLPDGRTPANAILLSDWDGTQAGPGGNQWVSNGYRRSKSYLTADFNDIWDFVTRTDASHQAAGPYIGLEGRWEWRNLV